MTLRVTVPADVVCLKGRGAPGLLEAFGVPVPPRPNSWRSLEATPFGAGAWCLRLGGGEYLLAHDTRPGAFDGLRTAPPPPACHVLLRADHCVHLEGPGATARLLQVCDVDERALLRQPDSLALLMLADVGVALHATSTGATPAWRIWCDPTWLPHVLSTFAAVAARPPLPPLPYPSPRQSP